MARLLILTDRTPLDSDWKGALVWKIILSLSESQHEVLVATTCDLESIEVQHPRLTVVKPVTSWRVDQLPKLVKLLLTYQPQIVHAFGLQTENLWPPLSLWPMFAGMCAVMPGVKRFSTLFDARDCGTASMAWHKQATRLTVFNDAASKSLSHLVERPLESVPLDLEVSVSPEQSDEAPLVLVPANVSEWEHPIHGLVHIRDHLNRHPATNFKIVGGWGDWPPSKRKEGWQILEAVASRVHMCEPVSYATFVDMLASADSLWLEPLHRESWKFYLSSGLAEHLKKRVYVSSPARVSAAVGSTANSLSRLYNI